MAGEPPLSSCEVCHCSRAHVRVQGCGHVLHGGCAGSSWPLSECPVCQAPCASLEMLNKLRRESAPASSVRHGRWTLEEERYADALIEDFVAGRLLLPSETKLVHFLKGVLHRTPAGVNRKFPKCKSLCYGGFKGPGTAWRARQQQLQELEGIHLIAAMQCTVGTSHDGELAAALTCEWQRLLADFCVEVEQPFEGSAAWAKANRSRRNRKVRQLRQQQEQRAQDGNDLAASGSVVHIHTDDSDGNEVGAVTPPPLSVTSATTPPPASDRGHVEPPPPPQQQRISPAAATASGSGNMPGAWACVTAADQGAGAGTKRSRSMSSGSGGSGGGEALLLDSATPAAVVAAADDALAAHGTLVPWPLHMSDQGALEPADHDECGSSSDSSASQHSMAVKLEHCAPVQPQQQQQQQRSTSAQQQQQRTTSVLQQQQQQQQREHNERCLDMWRHKRAPVSARRNFFDESLFDQMCSLIYNYKALSVMNPSFMEDSVVPLVLQVMSACSEDTAMWLIDLGQDMTIRAVTDGIAALELRPEDLEGHKLRALRDVNAMFHPDDRAEFVQLRERCCQDVSQAVTESADSATGGQIHTHARHWLKHTQCVRFRCNPLANGWADMVEAGTAHEDGYDCLKIERFFCTNRFLLLMDRVVMRGPSSRAPFGPPMSSFFTNTWPVPGNAFIKHGSWGLPRLTPRPRGGSGDYGGIKRHRAASYDAAAAPVRQQLPPQHARLPPHLDAQHSAQQHQQRSSQQQLSPVLPFSSAPPGKSSWHAPPPLPTYALPPQQQPASPYQHHHMHAPFGSYGSSSSVFGLTGGSSSASGMMPAASLAPAAPAPSLGDDEMAIWNQLFELIGASEAGAQGSAAAAAVPAAAAAAARFAPEALDPSPLAAALPLPLSPAAAAIDDCDYADLSMDGGAGCNPWDAIPPAAALPVASLWGDHDSALAAL